MKFAANLSLLWPDLPYLDRFQAAAQAGFEAVEVLFPYDVAAKETQRALIANGQRMVLMNAPPPNYTGGARGFAADPDLVDRFQYDLRRVLRYAEALKVPMIHVMTGDASGELAKQTLIENMIWAASEVPEGITLNLEPLSAATMPEYFLNDYDLAADIIARIDAPNVGLQFDSFHAQVIHGDAVAVFEKHASLVTHIQIGDAPDRTAPASGTVDFEGLFAAIENADYDGWISAEYHPNGPTEDTLDWMER